MSRSRLGVGRTQLRETREREPASLKCIIACAVRWDAARARVRISSALLGFAFSPAQREQQTTGRGRQVGKREPGRASEY